MFAVVVFVRHFVEPNLVVAVKQGNLILITQTAAIGAIHRRIFFSFLWVESIGMVGEWGEEVMWKRKGKSQKK